MNKNLSHLTLATALIGGGLLMAGCSIGNRYSVQLDKSEDEQPIISPAASSAPAAQAASYDFSKTSVSQDTSDKTLDKELNDTKVFEEDFSDL